MNKVIVILGQTATGKSDFAVEIAKIVNGEIISADSRQVYKGMDLGTGKITKKEMRGIKHYLLDIVSPSKVFSVSDFQKKAFEKIEEILRKPARLNSRSGGNKIPIICGGTGFYIDTVVNGTIFPEVPPNKKLRDELSKKTTAQLFVILEKLDKERIKTIDKNNPVRLIRAIEIAKALGVVPRIKTQTDTFSAMAENVSSNKYKVLKIGLKIPDEILKERIRTRLLSRIKKGMIKEIKDLHEKEKISWKRLESLGLEYRYVSLYLQQLKNLPTLKLRQAKKEEMIEKLNTEIWHFAKRQKTWFKRDLATIWIDPRKKSEKNKVIKKVKEFLK